MKSNKKKQMQKSLMKDIILLLITVIAAGILLFVFPDRRSAVLSASKSFFIEMILVFPAIMILIGLFAVFISNDIIVRYLGKSSGIKGIILALLLGSFPTGPMYVAFPMAAALLQKGARVSNIIIFLSAWACIKLPQELVELEFLGWRFMALRLILTIIFVVLMGYIIELLLSKKKV